MENPPASERATTDRSDDVRDSVCDDIRLDGRWKHQQFREGKPGFKPVGVGRPFVPGLTAFVEFIDTRTTYLAERRHQGFDLHP